MCNVFVVDSSIVDYYIHAEKNVILTEQLNNKSAWLKALFVNVPEDVHCDVHKKQWMLLAPSGLY